MFCCFLWWVPQHHLKKLNGRRLDFDYKRRRRGTLPAEEVRQAWDKFNTSKELTERSMFVLLQSDVRLTMTTLQTDLCGVVWSTQPLQRRITTRTPSTLLFSNVTLILWEVYWGPYREKCVCWRMRSWWLTVKLVVYPVTSLWSWTVVVMSCRSISSAVWQLWSLNCLTFTATPTASFWVSTATCRPGEPVFTFLII